jgi:hypothetical protein
MRVSNLPVGSKALHSSSLICLSGQGFSLMKALMLLCQSPGVTGVALFSMIWSYTCMNQASHVLFHLPSQWGDFCSNNNIEGQKEHFIDLLPVGRHTPSNEVTL